MAAQLSNKDEEYLRALRDAGVLVEVEAHRLDQTKGVILLVCSDGDRFYDIFHHQVSMQSDCRPGTSARIHVFAWHGGALACVPDSPINKQKNAHEIFLGQIPDAQAIKGIDIVALYAHAPCGAAGIAGITFERAITLQFHAKKIIKEQNDGIEVVCFFHVAYPNGKQRTYFLCRQQWEAFMERSPLQITA